jgi:hypothetical protein
MTNYEVGQIIYTILEEKQLVLPVQVVEQVVVKNLTGEETNYKVLLPNKKKQKVSIERLQKLFNSVDEASNYLLENAKKAIEIMASDACSLEKQFFKVEVKENIQKLVNLESEDFSKNSNKVKVSLPDGVIANIDMSNISEHIPDESNNVFHSNEDFDKETTQKKT